MKPSIKTPSKKRFIFFFLTIFIFGIKAAFAQETSVSANDYIPSAQNWSFIKYGNTPVNLYTGTATVEIPVYNYIDADFNIPISLSFVSNGFMPYKHSGILGLNWHLNAGGVITREIRGKDDENSNLGNNEDLSGKGFRTNIYTYDDENLLNFEEGSNYYKGDWFSVGPSNLPPSMGTETESDIYYFRFPGHSGTFHLDGQKNIKVYNTNGNHGLYEISFHKEQNMIKIKTGDGYTYYFGGGANNANYPDESYLERHIGGNLPELLSEFTIPDKQIIPLDISCPIISWQLRKIEAPNGRTIIYKYTNYSVPTNILWDQYTNPTQNKSNLVVTLLLGLNRIQGTILYKKLSVIKTTYLESIQVSNGLTVSFSYSPKEGLEFTPNYSTHDLRRLIQRLDKLDNIKIMYGSKQIKTCDMTYRVKDGRNLLQRVTIDGLQNYDMLYHENQSYVGIGINALDFWGFYNGKKFGDDVYTVPTTLLPSSNDEKVIVDSKNPNAEYSVIGNLKRITYPTRGYTEFEYDGHEAIRGVFTNNLILPVGIELEDDVVMVDDPILMPDFPTAYLQRLWSAYNQVGGIRVKKITDNDGMGNTTMRNFIYKGTKLNSNNYSGGTLLSFPRYKYVDINGIEVLNSIMTYNTNTFDQSHIEYGHVDEVLSDGSKIEYYYNDYFSHPDDYKDQKSIRSTITLSYIADSVFLNNIQRLPNSRHNERGKLNKVLYYDKYGFCVKKEQYFYEYPDLVPRYSTFVTQGAHRFFSAKIFTDDYRLTRILTSQYFSQNEGEEIFTDTSMHYDSWGQLKKVSILNNEGVELNTYKNYISELFPTSSYKSLPYQVVQTKKAKGQEEIVLANKYTYVLDSLPNPTRYSVAKLGNSITTNPDAIFNTLVNSDYEAQVHYEYNSIGNVIQSIDRNGIYTSYIWGHDGLYMIAMIENAGITSIKNISGLGNISTIPLTGNLTPKQESDLRALSNVLVSTYTYDPFIGVTSSRDASGRGKIYIYDEYSRLSEIHDDAGLLLEKYEYNHKN